MGKPIVSVCIPTYNRASYLEECLVSITKQFNDEEIRNSFNIYILDNQSIDNTEEVAEKIVRAFDNVKYVRDEKSRNIVDGIIKVASLGDGEYVWVFSDDDMQADNSLAKVLEFIKKNEVELIICNLKGFIGINTIQSENLLGINEDKFINSRKDFFEFLDDKFYVNIDYYTTLCSNWIIKKDIFDKNYYILEKFHNKFDLFPLPSLLFFTETDFRSGLIGEQIILYRNANEMWGKKNAVGHFLYRDSIWRDYYKKIIDNNSKYITNSFILKVHVKNLLRIYDLTKLLLTVSFKKIGLYNTVKKIKKAVNKQ